MFAVFENDGVLDTRLVTTLGTNVKTNESPIGYFGTGLKLALAVCARLNYPTYVQFGDGHTYMLRTQNDNVRGKDFSFINLSRLDDKLDIALPFTTEFGKNWEPWMVLRELESNMRDEHGTLSYASVVPPPRQNVVRFIIGGEFATKCEEYRRYTFFDLATTKMHSVRDYGDIGQPIGDGAVFYRGIRVGNYKPMKYSYNIIDSIDLTEDRTFKYYWQIESAVGKIIKRCTDSHIIEDILLSPPDTWEADSNDFVLSEYYYNGEDEPGAFTTFRDTSLRLYKHYPRLLNRHVYNIIRTALKEDRKHAPARTTTEQRAMLRNAISIVHRCGYDIKRFKVVVTESTDQGKYGWCYFGEDTIYLSPKVFEQGLECVVATLVEEFCHLDNGYTDNSRSMQDWLVRQLAMHMVALKSKKR